MDGQCAVLLPVAANCGVICVSGRVNPCLHTLVDRTAGDNGRIQVAGVAHHICKHTRQESQQPAAKGHRAFTRARRSVVEGGTWVWEVQPHLCTQRSAQVPMPASYKPLNTTLSSLNRARMLKSTCDVCKHARQVAQLPSMCTSLYLPLLSASMPSCVILADCISGFSLKGTPWSDGTCAAHGSP